MSFKCHLQSFGCGMHVRCWLACIGRNKNVDACHPFHLSKYKAPKTGKHVKKYLHVDLLSSTSMSREKFLLSAFASERNTHISRINVLVE